MKTVLAVLWCFNELFTLRIHVKAVEVEIGYGWLALIAAGCVWALAEVLA